MCGGVREFESMRAPAQVIALLHDDNLKPFGLQHSSYGDHQLPRTADDQFFSSPMLDIKPLSSTHQNIIKTRYQYPADSDAARAGLAIVAAISSKAHPPQLPSPICSRASPITNPRSRGTIINQDMTHVKNSQLHSPSPIMPARAPALCTNPAPGTPSIVTHDHPHLKQIQSSELKQTRKLYIKAEEKAKKKKSVFCSLFSPQDNYDIKLMAREAPSSDFMGACFACKRPLGCGKDIYIYRGDRAYCSNECRYQHIVEDEQSQRLQKPQQNLAPSSSTSAATPKAKHCNQRLATGSPFIPVLG